jgi:hypothetical protein
MSRKYTNILLEMLEGEMVSYEYVVTACLKYMSEDDVKDMMECNDILVEDEEK